MSGYGDAHPHSPHAPVSSPISIGWLLAASALIGLGLFMLAYWLVTFSWLYFLGIGPCVLGGVMLFSPRAGLDHA